MASLSGFGRVCIRIQDCSLRARESRLALALESAILAGSAGAGTIGDPTGDTILLFTTITPTFPTAESSPITTPSITHAGTSIALAGCKAEADFRAGVLAEVRVSMGQHRSMDSYPRNMDPRPRMPSLAAIPARLVALIMEESPEDSPLAGSRASVGFTAAEASTEVEAFMAAGGTGGEGRSE